MPQIVAFPVKSKIYSPLQDRCICSVPPQYQNSKTLVVWFCFLFPCSSYRDACFTSEHFCWLSAADTAECSFRVLTSFSGQEGKTMGGLSIIVLDVGVQAAVSGGQHRWHQRKLEEPREPAHLGECGASTLEVCLACRLLLQRNFGLTKPSCSDCSGLARRTVSYLLWFTECVLRARCIHRASCSRTG